MIPVFNPQVQPTQDPNYLNYSRVIDAPAPNQSSAIAINTASGVLDGAVTATDTAIKRSISDEAYKVADKHRDEYTAGLEKVKANLDQGIIPKPAQTATAPKSWLDANAMASDAEDSLPPGLQEGLDGITNMYAARAAGSPKLNDTQLAKDVLSEAKRMRSQYGPGYREYIDQKISEASGLPVANSYYNNMLLDINRQMAQMNKVKDDVGSAMMKNLDVPGMAGYITKRKAGDPEMTDSFILGKVADWQNLQTQIKIDAAKRAERSDLKKDHVDDQEGRLTKTLNSQVQMEMSGLKDVSLPGVGTAKDLMGYFDDVANNRIKQTEAEVGQKKMMFNNWVKNVETRMYNTAAGYGEVVGGKTAEERVKSAMAPIYAQQKFINSKEDGPAFFMTQQIEAIKKNAEYGILINKDYGKEAAQLTGARAIFGEQYFPDWLRSMTESGVVDKFKGVVSQENMTAIQPYKDERGQPIPRYHIDAIKHGKAIGATGDDDYFNEKGVSKSVSMIADPNMNLQAKDKLIDYAFNPKNVGRLEELKMDYRDPQTGKMVDGRYRMFNLLSAPGITQAIKATSLVSPENYKMYQKTLETEFGRLYRATLQDLNKVVADNRLGLHFSFNDKTNQFGIVDKDNRPVQESPRMMYGARLPSQYPEAAYVQSMLDKVDLINGGVANMANIHRNNPNAPVDTPKYLLQVLQTANFRPGSNLTGATEGMMKAIIKSKNEDMTPADLDKAILGSRGPSARSNFTAEEDRSLAAFLRSPAGRRGEKIEPQQTRGIIKGNLSDQPIDAPIRTYR